MARTACCPTCTSNLTVPDQAARGSFLRCSSCEEIFQPPCLKPPVVVDEDSLPYDPHSADRYDVRKPMRGQRERTAEDDAKAEVLKEVRRVGREPKAKWASRGVFSGIEGFFLVSAIVLAIGIPIAWFGMRRLTESNPIAAGFVVVGMCFTVLVFAALGRDNQRRARWYRMWGTTRRDY